MERRTRKCCIKGCANRFSPRSITHKVCGPECAEILALRDREKKEKKEIKQRKEALKSRSQWLAETQITFNAYIRKRDEKDPCISCGRVGKKVNAGHYLSVGSHPELRFHEDNCHRQCEYCNTYKSGNQSLYRIRLIEKIGIERVEWLEGPHDPVKYTIEDAKQIKKKYRDLLRELDQPETSSLPEQTQLSGIFKPLSE